MMWKSTKCQSKKAVETQELYSACSSLADKEKGDLILWLLPNCKRYHNQSTLSMWNVWPEFLLHWTPQPFQEMAYRKVWFFFFLRDYTWLLLALLLLPLMWLHEGTSWRLELHILFEGLSDSDYQWPSGWPWRCSPYAPLMETWRDPDVLGVCFEFCCDKCSLTSKVKPSQHQWAGLGVGLGPRVMHVHYW